MGSFVHLHVHSEYSLLDGMARLSDLCQYAKASGMEALALTDHGQMYGTIKFQKAAAEAGIKPIYGCEVYQARRRLFQREPQVDSKSYHLTLLAQNMAGYHNLLQLVTTANLEGFYYRPRIDKELLVRHADGLICLSGCISGEVSSLLAGGRLDEARGAVGWFKEVLGPDHYFLELQRHKGVRDQEMVNEQLVSLAGEFGLRCVATNDVHYVRRADSSAHEVLLAIQTNAVMTDPDRMQMGSDDYYLLTPQEMAELMPDYPEALENTLLIAEQCNVDLGFTGYHLPRFEVPQPHTPQAYLSNLCEEGLQRRYPEITPEIRARLDYELRVIHEMGFDDYFLITADLVNWAKNEATMLVGVRGSGASSLVAYALGVTDLEPLGLGLMFERLLNPGRVTMPDIDLDFPEDRRQEVLDYLTHRYGGDRTAQIATFGTMAARGAIRDVGRALDIPLPEVDHVAKLVPLGPKKTIQGALESVPELRELREAKPYIKELIDYSLALQGLSRHLSTHAAGVLIADRPLVEYTPLQRAPRGQGIISQFCMDDIEAIGLLKLDVLGLSALTALDRAFTWIECTRGKRLTQTDIPMDDPETYALLCSGRVLGVFQVESAGMRRTLREMQPTQFEEIVAVLGLYRPGPMQFIPNYVNRKFGREEVRYHHPALEPILAETYGIIVYQEQIIRIAAELAGYTPAEADLMRRAVAKKKKEDLEQQHAKFVEGAVACGIPKGAAEAIFADIELFADYGFAKSHGAAYAVLTLQTAYLKAHYPVEFMTALLSIERGNLDKTGVLITECRRLGIRVRSPDVSYSGLDFEIEPAEGPLPPRGGGLLGVKDLVIRFGLGAVKNVGDGPARVIFEARGDTPFSSMDDFAGRVDLRRLNKRVLECLVRAGAFDSMGERGALLAALDQVIARSQQMHRDREIGQQSLFDLSPDLMSTSRSIGPARTEKVPQLGEKARLADERELLGAYMSSHPLDLLSEHVDHGLTPCSDIDTAVAEQVVRVAGVINWVRVVTTKRGNDMAFAQLEDLSGTLELVIFPRTYEDAKELLSEDTLLSIRARVDVRDDRHKLIADDIEPYSLPETAERRDAAEAKARRVLVEIPLGADEQGAARTVGRVFRILSEKRGDVPFSFRLMDRHGRIEMTFPNAATAYSPQLEQQVADFLGPDHFWVEWA